MIGRFLRRLTTALCLAAALAPAASAEKSAPPLSGDQKVLVLLRLPPQHYRPGGDYSAGYDDPLARRAEHRLAQRIARAHGLELVESWPMPLLGVDCYVMTIPDAASAETTAAALARDPGVVWSEPMHVYHTNAARPSHNDPLYPVQPAARAWRLAALHQTATGRGVSVAVIDSQVEARHPDLAGQVAVNVNFAPGPAPSGELHGTAVAGIIAAKADNKLGGVGVAPGAKLLALRACRQTGAGPGAVCDSVSLAKALHFAVERRAQVINLSLGGPPELLLGKLIDVALARGATVVAAYDPALPHGGFPASHPGVLGVADEALARPPAGVYIAPGRDVPTTEPGGRWSLVDGSSYAAAHVSGLAALTRDQAGRRSGLKLVSASGRGGAIKACATVLRTAAACDCACPPAQEKVASLHR